MKSMAVSQFKAHALRVLDEIARSGESVLITRRGKPLARVVPSTAADKGTPGKLAHTLVFEDDIVSPLGEEMWETTR